MREGLSHFIHRITPPEGPSHPDSPSRYRAWDVERAQCFLTMAVEELVVALKGSREFIVPSFAV